MRRPSRAKVRDTADDSPPGGRALERLEQDRAARGLGAIPGPTTPILSDPEPAAAPRNAMKRNAKPRKHT
jgi:hypothetical protein